MNPELFQQLLLTVAVAVVSLIAFALRVLIAVGIEYLRAKLGESTFQSIRSYADVAVKMLEQSPAFTNFGGAEKKELAIVAVTQYAEKNHLPVDRELVEKVIEAAVQEMNSQLGKIDWDGLASVVSTDGGALTGGAY